MKNLVYLSKTILIILVALVIHACDKDEIDVSYNLSGDWKVVSFHDYEASTVVTKTEENTWPQFNNGDNTVSFIPSSETSGKVSGLNVTNRFSGDYTIDRNGGITLIDVIWTMINEPKWGQLFHSISQAESYEIRNGLLMIYYNQKKNSITLEKLDE
ncbi:hypothetical protein [Sunxiuqinia elliptica]|uniref:META domain-containing protein n=1 Tax=Sunxiuqinia elliptica TaxID=655355 RepID=A0A4R6H802_9BACT|nr:hypothetical protein [Sunxiuqinia elliptica]TDO03711.1 hypothetical protein DET52_10242 [Sunxiuqinia elliptica]TDO61992.1 hypothetical protein DET65_1718 [Sunxiuqinia elliptica]